MDMNYGTYVEISDYEGIFEKDMPVYGGVMKFLLSKLSDIPPQISCNVIEIGQLYEDIKSLSMVMFLHYVDLSMLDGEYYGEEVPSKGFPEEPEKNGYRIVFDQMSPSVDYDLPSVNKGPQIFINRYKKPGDRKIIVAILLFEIPNVVDSGAYYVFNTFEGTNKQEILDKIDEETFKQKGNDFSIYVIPSPVLYRVLHNKIIEFSKTIPKSTNAVLLSVEQLIDRYSLRTKKFEEDWKEIMEGSIKELKMKYPFLSALERNTTLREAYSELREAESIMGKSEHTNEDLKTIIHKATLAAESFLSILYEMFLGEKAGEKGFSGLLDSLVDKIQESFGEDEVSDLRRLAFFRNEVNHPKDHQFTLADSIKVLRWSQAFADLFSSQKFS